MSLRHAVKLVDRDFIRRYSARHFTSAKPGASRTRLVKDLTPRPAAGLSSKSTRKLIEVAPRDASSRFTRDPPPHKSRYDKKSLLATRRPAREVGGRFLRTSLVGREGFKNGKFRPGGDGSRPRTSSLPSSPVSSEFDFSTSPEPIHALPSTFSSPPLSPGLMQSVHDMLGPNTRPTPIQALSLKHLFATLPPDTYRQFLLASETGSGKSLAYLLPMLHDLKATEHQRPRSANPRALVLAPTHELSRQLASFGKALIHHSRLRVQCASQSNVASNTGSRVSAAKMANSFDRKHIGGEFEVRPGSEAAYALDVLVGTPRKLLSMARGNGWDKKFTEDEEERRKKWVVGRPEVTLSEVEWLIVDEADVLFDPDFIDQTLLLLSDIAAARGKPVPGISCDNGKMSQAPVPFNYPFNLVLTSATIPASLAAHLDTYHPTMTRLVSPRLHRLPQHLALEFAPYSSGNRNAEVLAKLKAIWRDDAHAGRARARIVIFANTRSRAGEMGAYLSERSVPNIVVTGSGIKPQVNKAARDGPRVHGSNKHLAGFLKPMPNKKGPSDSQPSFGGDKEEAVKGRETEGQSPLVLLSTSLLARGLDFDPSVSRVFILDPPRNTADFLHRAGRTARAGGRGKVVVFGKGDGRGAGKLRKMRQNLAALKTLARPG